MQSSLNLKTVLPIIISVLMSIPASASTNQAKLMQKGQQIYATTCSSCHRLSGDGMPPLYPALKGSAITNGSADGEIKEILNGKPGTAMRSFKRQLTDEEIAAVVTYIRNAWSNKPGGIVLPSDVAKHREIKK